MGPFGTAAALIILLGIGIYTLSRKRKIQAAPFPKDWESVLLERVAFYKNLSDEDRLIFQNRMMKFLAEVHVEAVQYERTDVDCMYVAASAVIPVFGFPQWHYNNLSTVLIYPDYFNEDLEFHDEAEGKVLGGLVGNGRFEGQMILSRRALHHGFINTTDKGNTGVHEFVHLMDKMDGATDGIPDGLLKHQYITPWLALMHKEMEAINSDTSDIRNYGGTKQAEFFAVASEYFFERPILFKKKHPELYAMLSKCFQQDRG